MNSSPSIANLSAALIAAQAEFPDVPKTKEVIVQSQKGSYTFKYAPLEKMIPILRPILTKHGLGFTQGADGDALVTTLLHSSGEWLSHRMPLENIPYAQQYGSQFTYRRRYSLKAALGIETDDDDADQTPEQKKIRNTPNAGAMDNVPKERHEAVTRYASSIIDCFNADQPDEAFKAYKEVTDNYEKLGVWSFLDSKMRRALKKMDEEARKGAH
jgi:hypothetical protein